MRRGSALAVVQRAVVGMDGWFIAAHELYSMQAWLHAERRLGCGGQQGLGANPLCDRVYLAWAGASVRCRALIFALVGDATEQTSINLCRMECSGPGCHLLEHLGAPLDSFKLQIWCKQWSTSPPERQFKIISLVLRWYHSRQKSVFCPDVHACIFASS